MDRIDTEFQMSQVVSALEVSSTLPFQIFITTELNERIELAEYALHRWRLFDRTAARDGSVDCSARVKYLARCLANYGKKFEVNPDAHFADYCLLAQVICDHLDFVLPLISTWQPATRTTTQLRRDALTLLYDVARAAGLTVNCEKNNGHYNWSYEAYRLNGRSPLWVIVHETFPVFAFTQRIPICEPGIELNIVDPVDFDFSQLLEPWRWLNATQANRNIVDGQYVKPITDYTDCYHREWRYSTPNELLFYYID